MTELEFNRIFPFKSPRTGQREVIEKIINFFEHGTKNVILSAPTGTGKSVIAYTIAKYFQSGYILTSQKCLQEQYHKDLNIPYVLGRNNYKCNKNLFLTCEFGACKNKSSKKCSDCPYIVYRDLSLNSDISDLNYAYYLSSINTYENNVLTEQRLIPDKNLLVCDECHNLMHNLIDTCSINLNKDLLSKMNINTIFPSYFISDDEKIKWLFEEIFVKFEDTYDYLEKQINTIKNLNVQRKEYGVIVFKYLTAKRIITKIKELKFQYDIGNKLIISVDEEQIDFKVLYADKLYTKYIEQYNSKILHMSATVLNKHEYCINLGIDENTAEYIELDSTFPEENRLIYYNPVGSLSYKNKQTTLPKLVKEVENIMKQYPDKKGIIHTTNYNIAEILISEISDETQRNRFIFPRGKTREETLNIFFESDEPLVLISPSLTEGIDLKDDLSRFCIICKVPYLNLADKWTSEKMKLDKKWYLTETAQILIQMTGRSVRSETDYCTTYILDSDFYQFSKNAIDIFPSWWKKSVKVLKK